METTRTLVAADGFVHVHVKADGTILMNGKLTSPGRGIMYSRANPSGDPPTNAMSVLRAAVEANVPIRMVQP